MHLIFSVQDDDATTIIHKQVRIEESSAPTHTRDTAAGPAVQERECLFLTPLTKEAYLSCTESFCHRCCKQLVPPPRLVEYGSRDVTGEKVEKKKIQNTHSTDLICMPTYTTHSSNGEVCVCVVHRLVGADFYCLHSRRHLGCRHVNRSPMVDGIATEHGATWFSFFSTELAVCSCFTAR